LEKYNNINNNSNNNIIVTVVKFIIIRITIDGETNGNLVYIPKMQPPSGEVIATVRERGHCKVTHYIAR